MSTRYHINDEDEVKECHAQYHCAFDRHGNHFDNCDDAYAYIEQKNEDFLFTVLQRAPKSTPHTTPELNACTPSEMPDLYFVSSTEFDYDAIQPITNDNFVKPTGGLWLSKCDDNGKTTWSNWAEEHMGENHNQHSQTHIQLTDNAQVLVIDSYDDLRALRDQYPPDDTDSIEPCNFEHVAHDWDAIHLTERGEKATHIPAFTTSSVPTLYGWDAESTLVLNKESMMTPSE